MTNRLINETSPYLLQHAHNPVNWYPWGEEALERARKEDRPILLSIGYSTCHWCHVMERESFENQNIAQLMNDRFVCIKVDREERPDLDHIYMQAVQALTGGGGWPLTVFLTPKGEPFYGGTYFPPEDRHGIPGLPTVIISVSEAYQHHRDDVQQVAKQIVMALATETQISAKTLTMQSKTLDQAYANLKRGFDRENGGFGTAPKFPHPMVLELLLRQYNRNHDTAFMDMVVLTLNKMADGGIYDQIGGGFHRYATDGQWQIPHFEKMLYDNALLSHVYLHGYLVTRNELFRSVAEETLDYVLREMTDPLGGFYSAQDADSEGIEGKYYLWTPDEIADVVGDEHSQMINRYFGVTVRGNLDGKNILHVAGGHGSETLQFIQEVKASLLRRREQRIKPHRDEKVLASWNGLMLASLAEAAGAFNRRDYLAAAEANGSFILNSMITDGHLKHTFKDGSSKIDGYLDDYAMVIEGFLALHQATTTGEWLRQAINLGDIMIEEFWDEATGTLYDTGRNYQDLPIRPRNTFDGALPSGGAAATLALLKLSRLTGNNRFAKVALDSLRSMQEFMTQQPMGFSAWLCALDFYLADPKDIAILGRVNDPATSELLHVLHNTWAPNKVVAAYTPSDPTAVSDLELLQNREMIGGRPTVYVCQRHTCQTPVTNAAELRTQLISA